MGSCTTVAVARTTMILLMVCVGQRPQSCLLAPQTTTSQHSHSLYNVHTTLQQWNTIIFAITSRITRSYQHGSPEPPVYSEEPQHLQSSNSIQHRAWKATYSESCHYCWRAAIIAITVGELPWCLENLHAIWRTTMMFGEPPCHLENRHDVWRTSMPFGEPPWHLENHHAIWRTTMMFEEPPWHLENRHAIWRTTMMFGEPPCHLENRHDIWRTPIMFGAAVMFGEPSWLLESGMRMYIIIHGPLYTCDCQTCLIKRLLLVIFVRLKKW